MSLFPRYANLPFAIDQNLVAAFSGWIKRWPRLADIYGAYGRNPDLRAVVTERIIRVSGANRSLDEISLPNLLVTCRREDDRLVVIDGAGQPLEPVFFGVSAASSLPAVVQFLLHLSGHRPSLIELLQRAINQIIVEAIRSGELRRFPAVYLGDHVLLSPSVLVVPRRALPHHHGAGASGDAFFGFHDWLDAQELPTLVQVRTGSRDPMWVDFRHPAGIG